MSEGLDAFDNPHYWLAAYGIRSHYFVWAVAHGALDDIEAGRTFGEQAIQLTLLQDVEPRYFEQLVIAPVAYRSRAPHKSDVLVEDSASRRLRSKLGIRLQDGKAVLRG